MDENAGETLEERLVAGRKMTIAGTDDIEAKEDNYATVFNYYPSGAE